MKYVLTSLLSILFVLLATHIYEAVREKHAINQIIQARKENCMREMIRVAATIGTGKPAESNHVATLCRKSLVEKLSE